ncbi:MAG: glycosyltransferase [Candidatus Shapirobacteria bacterium]|nr:glycosyltransferase [Candidatus Shapirobacteria bacterium]
MKSSLISTVLNEEKNIDSFLNSISRQTKKPNEIVVVDAGSIDKTITKIRKYQGILPIRLIIKKGVNRSRGRNLAIKNANNEIIVVSDVGCILDPSWLEKITKPLEEKHVSVVAGNYQPIANTAFQKCLAAYTCADIYKKGQFLPSSRSIAFKKRVWKKVGGYPKELNYCEDLVFDQKIKKAGFSFYFSEATVLWPQRDNVKQAFWQFHNYAFGDGQVFFSKYQTHSFKIALIFFRYLAALLILFLATRFSFWQPVFWWLLLAYFLWPIAKTKKIFSGKALLISPFIQLLTDLAVMIGTTRGIFANFKKRYNI